MMLLLMSVDDDAKLFDGLGAKINKLQELDVTSISKQSYYCLKRTLIKSN